LNQSSTSVASIASATPSTCGEVGDFTLSVSDPTVITAASN
jgi:hypothetical protein